MPVFKERNDKLFAAPVTFDDSLEARGTSKIDNLEPSTSGNSSGAAMDVSGVAESALTFDRIRYVRHARITITNLLVSILAVNDYGSAKILDLPDTNVLILGAEVNLSLDKDGSGVQTATDVTMGVGTAAASASTLSGAMIDVLTQSLTDDVDPALFQIHTHELATPALTFADDDASAALYLNAAATIAADGSLTATGTIDLYYIDTGNVNS
jgi:hypothetical protein